MKTVGYFDGIDPTILTRWVLLGIGTLPVSNGADGHGSYVAQLSRRDVTVVVGHLHKLVPPRTEKWETMQPNDLVYPLKLAHIPLVVIVADEDRDRAKEYLSEVDAETHICTPDELSDCVLEILAEAEDQTEKEA